MSLDALRATESVLAEWERERDLSCSVLVTEDGLTLLEACFGDADRANRVPITPATRFGLASVTKMFTAVAVVDLVAQGRLDLDTHVVDVLPPERRPSTLLPEVTVHHLLSHTSGIADYFEEEPPDGSEEADYADLWVDRPCYSIQRPAGLPAPLRRPPAVLATRRALLVLQRRLHPAGTGDRGDQWAALRRGGPGARLRPRGDGGERLLPARRRAARRRHRLRPGA